jgi:ABC-type nitrate/sulfonate/bicarbonate transport system permease component
MSDPDFEQLKNNLEETREIVERNNEMLQSIERSLFWRRIFTIFYWAIIIGIAVGLFYFLEPYVDRVFEAYTQFQGQVESIPGVGGSE